MASAKTVCDTVRTAIEPIAAGLGLTLWDVEFVKEGARQVLRVTIDKASGVTIDDCEQMHRAIDPVLDELDPIDVPYHLEVSSPGVERELRTDAHIDAFVGERVSVRLFAPVDGKKRLEGILRGRGENGEILLEAGAQMLTLPRAGVAKIQTVFDF